MYQDGYYSDVWMHLKCLNSDKAKQWRDIKRKEDKNYRRYIALISDGIHMQCNYCGHINNIGVKATRMAWEVSCTQCESITIYTPSPGKEDDRSLFEELKKTRELFVRDPRESTICSVQKTMEELAFRYDNLGKCNCGGIYSFSAKPRCAQCGEIAFDSYFHYVIPANIDF
jgi:hypothetical protein